MSINNESYDSSLILNLIQDLQQSEDKSQKILNWILATYGIVISETFTVQDFIKKCWEILWVNAQSLAIFELFNADVTENQYTIESSKQAQEWASEEMKNRIFLWYNERKKYNNSQLSEEDISLLCKLPLSSRIEWWEIIINLQWFGEFWSTKNADMTYIDMDKDGNRNIENLSQSHKFLTFKNKIQWMNIMSIDRLYALMNIIWSQLTIKQNINSFYIDEMFWIYFNRSTPNQDDVGKILEWLWIILHNYIVHPLFIVGKDDAVASLYFNYINSTFYINFDGWAVPLFEVCDIK